MGKGDLGTGGAFAGVAPLGVTLGMPAGGSGLKGRCGCIGTPVWTIANVSAAGVLTWTLQEWFAETNVKEVFLHGVVARWTGAGTRTVTIAAAGRVLPALLVPDSQSVGLHCPVSIPWSAAGFSVLGSADVIHSGSQVMLLLSVR